LHLLPDTDLIVATTDYNIASSLPANVEAERSILGAILLDNLAYTYGRFG
jgi:hypothetical protein